MRRFQITQPSTDAPLWPYSSGCHSPFSAHLSASEPGGGPTAIRSRLEAPFYSLTHNTHHCNFETEVSAKHHHLLCASVSLPAENQLIESCLCLDMLKDKAMAQQEQMTPASIEYLQTNNTNILSHYIPIHFHRIYAVPPNPPPGANIVISLIMVCTDKCVPNPSHKFHTKNKTENPPKQDSEN